LGDLSPDAHLLLSKTYLIQRKYALGKNMLSRTVDIAWQKKRYDVLSEAFRLMAEQALFDEDVDGAVRPYRQAIAQCDDGELRARWQLELAALYYRLSKFEKAEKEFEKVLDESPELIAVFEAELYRASSLSYQRKFRQAAVILEDLNSNDNYKEWRHAIHAEKMRMMRLDTATSANEMDKVEKEAEKFTGSTAIPVALFEKAMDYFHAGKYTEAKLYYAKAKAIKSPVSEAAGKYFQLLNEWENKQKQLGKGLTIMDSLKKQDTSLVTEGMKGAECMAMYQLGRIHEQLENADSADFYYLKAATMVSPADTNRPRYLYGLQRRLIAKDPDRADSLMEILAYNYGKTPYGQEARLKLGFTEAVVIDTVAELYISGTRFRATNNYELAIRQFIRIAEGWRESAYAPKALYSTGWIFENKLLNKDSAIYYYRLLVERYPQSDYAKDIRPGVEMALAYQSGMYDPATGQMLKPGQKPDTTGNAGRPAIQAVPDSVVKAGQPPRNADTVMQVKDSVPKNPANMLQNQMNSLQNQINSIPTDMKSLEKMKPDIKVTTPFDKLIPNQMPSLPFFGKDKNPAPTDSVKKDGPP
jgi:tetratricopeptide (TPR) repeat protein